jgi:hypothetical protein
VIPASKKGNTPDYSPSEKDISKEAAADKIASKITTLVGDDLNGYTAEMLPHLVKGRSTWFECFTSADKKTQYRSEVDAVTGEVWDVGRMTPTSNGGEDLYYNSKAVFGYDLRAEMKIFSE